MSLGVIMLLLCGIGFLFVDVIDELMKIVSANTIIIIFASLFFLFLALKILYTQKYPSSPPSKTSQKIGVFVLVAMAIYFLYFLR